MRWLTIALALGAMVWLGYAVGRVQSIGELARLYRDADTDRYSLTRGGTLVHFERLGGAGKPYLRTAEGVELLELSDWDRGSRVIVDGTPYELVRLYPGSSVDYERYRLVSTLHGDGWLLEREVTLEADGSVRVDHTFIARRPIRRVELALAHSHSFFTDLELQATEATATVNHLSREEIQAGGRAPAEYRVRVTAQPPGVAFRAGDGGNLGISSFILDLSANNPVPDRRTPLGSELIRVERL